MSPYEASANKTVNITQLGPTYIPVPTNPTGKLLLIRIVINKKGASSNTATIYDDVGINSNSIKGILDTTDKVGHVDYEFPMCKGIYIVVATGTAPDLTVVYKEL